MAQTFEAEHARRFGFVDACRAMQLAKISVEAVEQTLDMAGGSSTVLEGPAEAVATVQLRAGGAMRNAPVFRRETLPVGKAIDGPALVIETGATTFIDAGWRGDFIEAEAFAYLAVRSLRGLPISFPTTTGARRPLSGGVLAVRSHRQ